MAPDILLIGTGITSALSAAILHKHMPTANVVLWDKARGIGGRMSRSINPKDVSCSADLGAQYITTNTETMEKYKDIYDPLIANNIIEALTAGVLGMRKYTESARHFVAPLGMNSVVKYFLNGVPKENIRFESKVIAIEEENGKFRVKSEKDSCAVDVVVSTMPIPQFLQMAGSVRGVAEHRSDLESVVYSSRFVLVLFFDKSVKFPSTDWACQYLDHEVFRYVSVDNMKRNRSEDPVAVVFHTSVKFGLANLEMTLPDMEKVLLKHAKDIFPDWPEPSATKCHKWRFSQIVEPFKGKPGCLVVNRKPALILGGDAFSDSNFDGCVYSAVKIVEAIRQLDN